MKILVGMPVYDGKVQAEIVKALFDEQVAAQEIGDTLILNILPG